jgi:hypothetical protein
VLWCMFAPGDDVENLVFITNGYGMSIKVFRLSRRRVVTNGWVLHVKIWIAAGCTPRT